MPVSFPSLQLAARKQDHLLFRDYLRSHGDEAEGYARLKRRLAVRLRDDRLGYTQGKTGFVLAALRRAEEWAAATGWSAVAG